MNLEEILGAPLKIGGSAVGLVSILTFMWKSKPITTLTSTSIEKVLLTKESRTSINIFRYLFESWAVSLAATYLVFCFWLFKINAIAANTIVVFSVIFVAVALFEAKSQNTLVRFIFKSEQKRKYASIFLIIFLYFFVFSIVPAFLTLGIKVQNLSIYKPTAVIEIFILLDLFLIIPPVFFLYPIKEMANAIVRGYQRYNGEYFYIVDEEKVKWYIYHPIEKDRFLLGDKYDDSDAEVFKMIEKSVLVNQKIWIEKVSI